MSEDEKRKNPITNSITDGVTKAALNIYFFLLSTFMWWVLVMGLLNYSGLNRNSTDSKSSRSGINLYIDDKTGCHYLSDGNGLIKRTDINGSHICTGQE